MIYGSILIKPAVRLRRIKFATVDDSVSKTAAKKARLLTKSINKLIFSHFEIFKCTFDFGKFGTVFSIFFLVFFLLHIFRERFSHGIPPELNFPPNGDIYIEN